MLRCTVPCLRGNGRHSSGSAGWRSGDMVEPGLETVDRGPSGLAAVGVVSVEVLSFQGLPNVDFR
jgi:hypothetical protein